MADDASCGDGNLAQQITKIQTQTTANQQHGTMSGRAYGDVNVHCRAGGDAECELAVEAVAIVCRTEAAVAEEHAFVSQNHRLFADVVG